MIQDQDVDRLSVDQLLVEVKKLREGIRRHRDSTGVCLQFYEIELRAA